MAGMKMTIGSGSAPGVRRGASRGARGRTPELQVRLATSREAIN